MVGCECKFSGPGRPRVLLYGPIVCRDWPGAVYAPGSIHTLTVERLPWGIRMRIDDAVVAVSAGALCSDAMHYRVGLMSWHVRGEILSLSISRPATTAPAPLRIHP